ncbi:MAG: hypothetical protein V1867_00075 [Candidatus Falkowbacteria bacterium]
MDNNWVFENRKEVESIARRVSKILSKNLFSEKEIREEQERLKSYKKTAPEEARSTLPLHLYLLGKILPVTRKDAIEKIADDIYEASVEIIDCFIFGFLEVNPLSGSQSSIPVYHKKTGVPRNIVENLSSATGWHEPWVEKVITELVINKIPIPLGKIKIDGDTYVIALDNAFIQRLKNLEKIEFRHDLEASGTSPGMSLWPQ